jgi:putative ABC transport system substrate-binding protein
MQFCQTKRREFITLIGMAAAWPLVARAQQGVRPVVGFLHARAPEDMAPQVAGFGRGLAEHGYVDGESVTVEYRWGRGHYEGLPALATELVRRPVAVLCAGGDPAAIAAKAATATIPTVFSVGNDPVRLGLVASLNRPGGNATGINILTSTLEAKRLGLLRDLLPQATIGVLLNPNVPLVESHLHELQQIGAAIGLRLVPLWASDDDGIDAALAVAAQQRVGALLVTADTFFDIRRDKLVAAAARLALPAMYQFREYAAAGGLMSYGIDLPDVYRQVGGYVGKILKGARPVDLPVLQPTKFELVINLHTARTLALAIPSRVLAIADEVIE